MSRECGLMLKSFLNIFLIIVIAFSTSVIPVNKDMFNLSQDMNFSLPFKNEPNDVVVSGSEYTTNTTKEQILNPTTIEFTMLGNFNKEKALLSSSNTIVLEVFRGDVLVKEFYNADIIHGELKENSKDNNELTYNLDLSQNNLNLANGYYTFKIHSSLDDFSKVSPYKLDIIYLDDSKYIPAKDNVEQGYMYLTLYFPDNQVLYSIPVSRKIPHTRKTINATIENLIMGPDNSLGLNGGSPIPKVTGLWISNKTAVLNLPEDLGIYEQGSASSQSALNSFVNSITSIYGVDNVQFLQNGKEVETMFHGTYVKDPFQGNVNTQAYLGFIGNSSRVLLTPISIENYPGENIASTELVSTIFTLLRTASTEDFTYNDLIPTIPQNIDLIDFEIVDKTLILNFNKAFINAYEGRDDLQSMMIDSILYSFTSMPDVSRITIKIEGEPLDSLNNIELSEAMEPPSYINIEQ